MILLVPAHQRYPAPHEQMLVLARQALAAGLTFEEFFDRAVPPLKERRSDGSPVPRTPLPRVGRGAPGPGQVLWPRDTWERKIAYEAALDSREGWRSSYDGLTAKKSESAFATLAAR